uniref:uncharacterized protein LOC120327993 n=1 Tax=Styela clava TaxID=7725 RepID=UPI001939FBB0|nr:uncharacterized protein LOC120327993 [Styela clava]
MSNQNMDVENTKDMSNSGTTIDDSRLLPGREENGLNLTVAGKADKDIPDDKISSANDIMLEDSPLELKAKDEDLNENEFFDPVQLNDNQSINDSCTDVQSKYQSDNESSPPSTATEPGRRKRKPSRYHDSMFDIPTKLMNINRTINPEEFRAFHSKSSKNKEKLKKLPTVTESMKEKPAKTETEPTPAAVQTFSRTPEFYGFDSQNCEDDLLDANNMFKFKMRKDHVIQNAIGGPSAYRCDICMMSFPRSFSLRRHYTRRHINPKYVLPKAGSINVTDTETAGLTNKDQEEAPNEEGDLESKYLYACKMCCKELMYFQHKNQLRTHCLESHNTEPRRSSVSVFKCELCKRSYSTRHELQRHKRTHSGEKPYACNFCSKTFPTSTNARRHERTHTGDKPHVCKVCNKGFIQRTDMVKHLRSVHKMKVTKTKAERGSNGKSSKISFMGQEKCDLYGVDGSNEFQENIDFAAYLKLDQHDSGTLMGEKRAVRTSLLPNPSKDQQENNSNNYQNAAGSQTNKGLIGLPPTLKVGSDGRLEKCHRCPDCSKMFTTNINLRRHHKLKHERNQLYQCAEPVSMVVEKYKIKNDNAGLVFEQTQKFQQMETDNKSANVQMEQSLETNKEQANVKSGEDITDVAYTQANNEGVFPDATSTQEKQKNQIAITKAASTSESVSKRTKGLSKLSSIVQRLASKRSAEQPGQMEKGNMKGEQRSTSPPDLQPMIKLEQMETQMFKDYFSSDNTEEMSPKRKRRKPNNVQHVRTQASYNNKLQSCIENEKMVKLQKDREIARQFHQRHHVTEQHKIPIPNLRKDEKGPYHHVFHNNDNKIRPPNLRKILPNDVIGRFSDRERSILSQQQQKMRRDIYEKQSMIRDRRMAECPDISKSFAPLTSQPFPLHHTHRHQGPSSPGSSNPAESSRIQAFLSQCWSSRRHDIPKNAILDKNMPSRKSNEMNKNLRYHMRHNPTKRINEHLPASAYFSHRDPMANVRSPPYVPYQQPTNLSERKLLSAHANNKMSPKPGIDIGDDENSPLDLRVQSKKVVPDYVVTDDGVLDFSRKSTENRTMPPQSTANSTNQDHMRIKMERRIDVNEERFSHNKTNLPIPSPDYMHRQYHPDNMPGNSNWPDNSPSHISQHQMLEHRRAIIHGKSLSPQTKKPFKFHPVNFKPPPVHSAGKGYTMGEMRKNMPPPPLKPFRDHPRMPGHLPPTIPIPPEHRRPIPSMISQRRPLPNPPPGWCVPKQEMLMQHMNDHPSHKHHMNYHHGPPCSMCDVPSMPLPRRQSAEFMRKPGFPFHNKPREIRTHNKPHIEESRPAIAKPVHKQPPMQYKMKSAPTQNPNSFCDQDMMDRCIRKAQQALKVETLGEFDRTDGTESREMVLPDPTPVFRSSVPILTHKNEEIIKSASTSVQDKKDKLLACPPRPPRVSAHILETAHSEKKTSIVPAFPNQKKDSPIGPPPPLFSDEKTVKHSSSEKKITPTDPEEISNKDIPEEVDDNQPVSYARQNLTMTPDLDYTQEDSSESSKTSFDKEIIKESETVSEIDKDVSTESLNGKEVLESEDSSTQLMNADNKDQKNVTSSEKIDEMKGSLCLTEYSSQNLSDSPSSTSCPEYLSSELKTNSTKISHRRHTHTHRPGHRKDFSSHKTKALKRSNSSESPQIEDLTDNADSKKVIKKLKLRVIKSPGSEHKKYWTLVKQDQQAIGAKRNLEHPKQSTSEDASLQKPEIENTSIEKDEEAKTIELDIKIETKLPEKEKTSETDLKDDQNKEPTIKNEDEDTSLKNTQISEKSLKSKGEGDKKDTSIVEKTSELEPIVCINQLPNHDGYSILTNQHVESALSAVLDPAEVQSDIDEDTEKIDSQSDILDNSNEEITKEKNLHRGVAMMPSKRYKLKLKSTLETVEGRDLSDDEQQSEPEQKIDDMRDDHGQSYDVKQVAIKNEINSNKVAADNKYLPVNETSEAENDNAAQLDKKIIGTENSGAFVEENKNTKVLSKNSDDNIFTRMTKDEIEFESIPDTDAFGITTKSDDDVTQKCPPNEDTAMEIDDNNNKQDILPEDLTKNGGKKFIRKTRSTVTGPPFVGKKNNEKKTNVTEKLHPKNIKKSEPAMLPTIRSNSVRRSQRIRKSSSDKDAATRKKK